MGLVYFALGGSYSHFRDKKNEGFLVLYGLTFFFANFGPNTTTFIVPAELFPARFRSTCHGIAGSTGKLGALIGTLGVLWALDEKDESDALPKAKPMTIALVVLGVVCLLGMVLSYFYTPETMGRSLEENEIDNGNDDDDDDNERRML